MKITTQWQQGQQFVATTENGHQIPMDGNGSASSPMQLILAALGGCSSIDVVMILEKGRNDITNCQCELTAKRANGVPAVFTHVNAHYVVTGNNLKEETVKRACELSMQKYCSVAMMLEKSVDITFTYEVKNLA